MPDTATIAVRNGQGLFLTGKFVGIELGSYTNRKGETKEPATVTLLAGRLPYSIEFRSIDEAIAALGGSEPDELSEVMVPVYANGPWDGNTQRRGPVFFSGRVPGAHV